MKERFEIAQEKFDAGFNCSQSVLFAFADLLDADEQSLLNFARGFGAGMGRKEEVCGAVTGGILALGGIVGSWDLDENSKREFSYSCVRGLMDEFSAQWGTYLCRDLLDGIDLGTKEGKAQFAEKGYRKNVCLRCVGESAKITEKLILGAGGVLQTYLLVLPRYLLLAQRYLLYFRDTFY